MNRVFETLFKFVNKYFILIAIVQVIIFNIYFFTITRHEEYFTENVCMKLFQEQKLLDTEVVKIKLYLEKFV